MPQTRHVRADTFLKENFTEDKDFAVWDGELYLEMHRGTFTTKAALKKYNRELEEKFRTAELLSVLRGADYPAERIRSLYKKFLLQQFHDILPGSHITPVFEDAMADLAEVEQGLDEIIGTGDTYFNTLIFERNGVEFIPDPHGAFVRKGVRGDYEYASAAALSDVQIHPRNTDTDWISINGNTVETDAYRIVFAPDGAIESLMWKEKELVAGPFNKLRLYDDKPGNYDAWDILPNYMENERPLTLLSPLKLTALSGKCAEFTAVEGTEKSRIERKIRLFRYIPHKGLPGIEVEVIADWHESHKLLKVEFTPNVLTRELTCDTSAGFIKRPMHKNTSWESARFECCTHKWFDLSETDFGVAVINDGKYGVGIGVNSVTLSLLRATERPDPQSDLGTHDFCYLIVPHSGDPVFEGINRKALVFNAPLVRTAPVDVDGELLSLLDAFSERLHLQALKKSEDGKKTVCRLIETDGRRGNINLDRTVTVADLLERPLYETDVLGYKPFEIITLML
jgi:alpha-mannosidase